MEDDQWQFQESHLFWVHLINMPINSSLRAFSLKSKISAKVQSLTLTSFSFLHGPSVCLLNGFYQLKCNFDVQGKQSVLVFMAVHVAVCFLFNSMLPLYLIV